MRVALAMYVGVFLMVTCGGLLGADFAHATELAPENRAQITTIVNQASPESRCGGQVRIVWVHDLQAKAPELAAKSREIQGYAYGVDDGSCTVGVRSDLEPDRACTVALHERQHLMGVGHATGDPLMGNAEGDFGEYRDPRCAGVLALHYLDVMEEMWSRTRATTHVRCKRLDVASFTCTTTATRGERVQKTWIVKAAVGNRVVAGIVAAIA